MQLRINVIQFWASIVPMISMIKWQCHSCYCYHYCYYHHFLLSLLLHVLFSWCAVLMNTPGLCDSHGSHRPGKVMEFNPWLEKSLNFMLTWKNGILPGKVIENQWKSLKNLMCHVKLILNIKNIDDYMIKSITFHYIWEQIGETMLADLHGRAACYIAAEAEPLVTL